ncbi:hypothetical protein P9112_004225 [Eukaryota sp. TZLM1-RC]
MNCLDIVNLPYTSCYHRPCPSLPAIKDYIDSVDFDTHIPAFRSVLHQSLIRSTRGCSCFLYTVLSSLLDPCSLYSLSICACIDHVKDLPKLPQPSLSPMNPDLLCTFFLVVEDNISLFALSPTSLLVNSFLSLLDIALHSNIVFNDDHLHLISATCCRILTKSLSSPLSTGILSILGGICKTNCPKSLAFYLFQSFSTNPLPCYPNGYTDYTGFYGLDPLPIDITGSLLLHCTEFRDSVRFGDFIDDQGLCFDFSKNISLEFPAFGPVPFPGPKGWTFSSLIKVKSFPNSDQSTSSFSLSLLNLATESNKLILDISLVLVNNSTNCRLSLTYGHSFLRHSPSLDPSLKFPLDGISFNLPISSLLNKYSLVSVIHQPNNLALFIGTQLISSIPISFPFSGHNHVIRSIIDHDGQGKSNFAVDVFSSTMFNKPLNIDLLHVITCSSPLSTTHPLSLCSDGVVSATRPDYCNRIGLFSVANSSSSVLNRVFLDEEFNNLRSCNFLFESNSAPLFVFNFKSISELILPSGEVTKAPEVRTVSKQSVDYVITPSINQNPINHFDLISHLYDYNFLDSFVKCCAIPNSLSADVLFKVTQSSFRLRLEFFSRHLHSVFLSLASNPRSSFIKSVLGSSITFDYLCDCNQSTGLIYEEGNLRIIFSWELWNRKLSRASDLVAALSSIAACLPVISRYSTKSPAKSSRSPLYNRLDRLSSPIDSPRPVTSSFSSNNTSPSISRSSSVLSFRSNKTDFTLKTSQFCDCCFRLFIFNRKRLFSINFVDFIIRICFSTKVIDLDLISPISAILDSIAVCTCKYEQDSSCALCDFVYHKLECFDDLVETLRKGALKHHPVEGLKQVISNDRNLKAKISETIMLSLYFRCALSNHPCYLFVFPVNYSRQSPSPESSPECESGSEHQPSDNDSQSLLGRQLLEVIRKHLEDFKQLIPHFLSLHPLKLLVALLPDSGALFPGLISLINLLLHEKEFSAKFHSINGYNHLSSVFSSFSVNCTYLRDVLTLLVTSDSINPFCLTTVCGALLNGVKSLRPEFIGFSSELIKVLPVIRSFTHSLRDGLGGIPDLFLTLACSASCLTGKDHVTSIKMNNQSSEVKGLIESGIAGKKSGSKPFLYLVSTCCTLFGLLDCIKNSNTCTDALYVDCFDTFQLLFDLVSDCVLMCDFPSSALTIFDLNLGDYKFFKKILEDFGIVDQSEPCLFPLFLNSLSLRGIVPHHSVISIEYLFFKRYLSVLYDSITTCTSQDLVLPSIRDLLTISVDILPRIVRWNPSSSSLFFNSAFSLKEGEEGQDCLCQKFSDICLIILQALTASFSIINGHGHSGAMTSTLNSSLSSSPSRSRSSSIGTILSATNYSTFIINSNVSALSKAICDVYGSIVLCVLFYASTSAHCIRNCLPILKAHLIPSGEIRRVLIEKVLILENFTTTVLFKLNFLLNSSGLEEEVLSVAFHLFRSLVLTIVTTPSVKKSLSRNQKTQFVRIAKSLPLTWSQGFGPLQSILTPLLIDVGFKGNQIWSERLQTAFTRQETLRLEALKTLGNHEFSKVDNDSYENQKISAKKLVDGFIQKSFQIYATFAQRSSKRKSARAIRASAVNLTIQHKNLVLWDSLTRCCDEKELIKFDPPKISFKVDPTECNGVYPRLELDVNSAYSVNQPVDLGHNSCNNIGDILLVDKTGEAHPCVKVSIFGKVNGELLLSQDSLHFRPLHQHCSSQAMNFLSSYDESGCNGPELIDWWSPLVPDESINTAYVQTGGHWFSYRYTEILGAYKRTFLLDDKALEIFGKKGSACISFLIAFECTATRDAAFDSITNHLARNHTSSSSKQDDGVEKEGEHRETLKTESTTRDWIEGRLTNFEYLLRLNQAAGRSFHDVTQYPVFPVIIKDHNSSNFDLSNPGFYRDLTKPIGAQDPVRMQRFIERYYELLSMDETPYHYGSHFSNASTALYYLVRLEPFATLHRSLNDGKYDLPDRLFHDITLTWGGVSGNGMTSMQDVKELVPELFYNDESLLNSLGLELGVRQNQQPVDDVKLPLWARNAREFVFLHRKALESPLVSQYLPHWIDLVFGYKQRGKFAVESVNVFHPLTYGKSRIKKFQNSKESAKDQDQDCVMSEARQVQIMNYGQMPIQLFPRPHPSRRKVPTCQSGSPLTSLDRLKVVNKIKLDTNITGLYWIEDDVVYYRKEDSVMVKIFNIDFCLTLIKCCNSLILYVVQKSKPKTTFFIYFNDLFFDSIDSCCSNLDNVLAIDGNRLFVVLGSVIKVYDVEKCLFKGNSGCLGNIVCPSLVGCLRLSGCTVCAIHVVSNYNVIVTCDDAFTVTLWDSFRLIPIRTLSLPLTSGLSSPQTPLLKGFTTTGDVVVVVDNLLFVYTVNGRFCYSRELKTRAQSLDVSDWPVGVFDNIILIGHQDGSLSCFKLVTGELVANVLLVARPILSVKLVPFQPSFATYPTNDRVTLVFSTEEGVYECVCI